jgi:FHA domain
MRRAVQWRKTVLSCGLTHHGSTGRAAGWIPTLVVTQHVFDAAESVHQPTSMCHNQNNGQGQPVTHTDHDPMSHELIAEADSAFVADLLHDLNAPVLAGAQAAVSGVEPVPPGSAVLLVKRGPTAGSRFLLGQTVASAGRHPDCDICLDDVTVSRRHAEFHVRGGEFHLVDVGSLNGTYVNREPIDSIVLANGDQIQLGKFRLVFLTGPRRVDSRGHSR